jgi:hypothetical protein
LAAYIKTVERVVAGDLRERSPACDGDDPFDRLGVIVNGMLGMRNDIALDLQMPLTRVRARLERG